jgi:poly(3-hydroxybutyrate) depolymerase
VIRTLRLTVLLVGLASAPTQAAVVQSKMLTLQTDARPYHLYIPNSVSRETPVPLLIVLHGSGGSAQRMVERWASLADEQAFVIAGPQSKDPLRWQLGEDPAEIFRALIADIASAQAIDTRRIYLFGHSGGAVYALSLSMMQSKFFAATAVHAGAWRERQEFKVAQLATRKIPVMLFIGNRDEYFSVDSVKQTAAQLRKAQHEVSLVIMPRHDHDYGEVAESVNAQAWAFLRTKESPNSAIFQLYE